MYPLSDVYEKWGWVAGVWQKLPPKPLLPETDEVKEKKKQAQFILQKAFKEVHDMGLRTVCFDVKWNEPMTSSSVSVITPEEWEWGVWPG
jgi:hypothetical protein